jgi:hypothetical protein
MPLRGYHEGLVALWHFDEPYGTNTAYDATINGRDGEVHQANFVESGAMTNQPPEVDAGPDKVINEGDTFTSSGSFTDPDSGTWIATVDYGDGSGLQPLALTNNTFNLSHIYVDDGVYTVTVIVTDDNQGVGADTVEVTVNNVAPEVDAGPDWTINECDTFTSSGFFIDPGSDTWTATVDYGDGSDIQPLALTDKTFDLNHIYTDDGVYAVTVIVTDDDGGVGAKAVEVTVNNIAPVADAGSDQLLYVCTKNELADVTLDGSGSYDVCDEIAYYWSWIIDSNLYEAIGASPTIQLPVGEHEIKLIVNDGTEESEPNYCTVTVEGPLWGKMLVKPKSLNIFSHKRTITAVIRMPRNVTPEDIDANVPLIFIPGDIESKKQFVFQWGKCRRSRTYVVAMFGKDDCVDNLSLGKNRIKVRGILNSGQCYYGKSRIYIHKPRHCKKPWWRFHRHHH